MVKLAPIALFVYNRPLHTRQTLEALSQNELANESVLYVFADGPKEGASAKQLDLMADVKKAVKEKQWCKEVVLIERTKNHGLAGNVIDGVTKLANEFGNVIVLEDDLVTARGFLKYMNTALEKYQQDEKVMQVSGHAFSVNDIVEGNSSFFIPLTTSWGWATWKRAWDKFDGSAKGYEVLKSDKELELRFNLDGAFPYSQMLYNQMEIKNIDSWAIRWWWSVFKENGLVLFPDKSLVDNIGFDLSGTHTKGENPFRLNYFDNKYYIFTFPDEITINNKFFVFIKTYIYKVNNKGVTLNNKGIFLKIMSEIRKFLRLCLD